MKKAIEIAIAGLNEQRLECIKEIIGLEGCYRHQRVCIDTAQELIDLIDKRIDGLLTLKEIPDDT